MLDLMRKHARNWLMKALLGIIIIVFIFYFGSLRGNKQAETLASIGKKDITYTEFHKEYESLVDFYRQIYGANLTKDILNKLNLKQQALDNLINQTILLQKAQELKIQVSDEDVRTAIITYPAFQRSGTFDQQIYERMLRVNKLTPEDFEGLQKKLMIVKKLEALIQDAVKVSDQELRDIYRFQTEKININFTKLQAKEFRSKAVFSQKELETYLKENENLFKIPEKIQLKYVSFLGKDFTSLNKMSDMEVADYYNAHKDEFSKAGGGSYSLTEVKDKIIAELRQISGMHTAAEEAKKAHDVIYQEENFDAYVSQNKLKSNVTDFFPASEIPQAFKQIPEFAGNILGLQKNEVSKVLSDEKGYYLFKLEARKPPYLPALKEIEKDVTNAYLDKESLRLCKSESENILKRLQKGAPWEKVVREKGLKSSETGFFLPGAKIPELTPPSRDLLEALFQLSEKKPYPDKVFNVDKSYVIIRFKDSTTLDNRDFEAKKNMFKNTLLKMKRNEILRAWIEGSKEILLQEGKLKVSDEFKNL
jgi:peptidyl-prolyl cis-trans isomerase D